MSKERGSRKTCCSVVMGVASSVISGVGKAVFWSSALTAAFLPLPKVQAKPHTLKKAELLPILYPDHTPEYREVICRHLQKVSRQDQHFYFTSSEEVCTHRSRVNKGWSELQAVSKSTLLGVAKAVEGYWCKGSKFMRCFAIVFWQGGFSYTNGARHSEQQMAKQRRGGLTPINVCAGRKNGQILAETGPVQGLSPHQNLGSQNAMYFNLEYLQYQQNSKRRVSFNVGDSVHFYEGRRLQHNPVANTVAHEFGHLERGFSAHPEERGSIMVQGTMNQNGVDARTGKMGYLDSLLHEYCGTERDKDNGYRKIEL